MKYRVLILVLFSSIGFTATILAQNKTLGVGATTPNENAALHVESPTNNQGFIMPRLTTAQRVAMTLDSDDIGLLVYDRDLQEVVSWNGTDWADAGTFLSSDTTATLHVVNNGTIAGSDVAGSAAILAETTNAFSAITGRIPSSASGANAISGITRSTNAGSWAGYFDALTGTAVWGTTASDVGGALAPVGVYGESTGTGSVGGAFWVQNAENTYPALYSNTIGAGPSLSVNVTNTANASPALFVETNGENGQGATVRKTGTGNGFGLSVESFGGEGLRVDNKGTTNGYAGVIQNWETTNAAPALLAEATGAGASVWALKSTDAIEGDALLAENWIANGSAGRFVLTDATNTFPALVTTTAGAGAAIVAENTGSGNGFAGSFINTGVTNTYPAIQAETNGSGPGIAVFQNAGTGGGLNVHMQNAASNVPGIMVDQQGLGPALQLNRSNNGLAIDIGNGVVKYSTFTVPTGGGTITDVAVFYILQDGGTYTFAAGQEGEVRYAYASSQSPTVNSVVMSSGEINQFVYLSGDWRLIN